MSTPQDLASLSREELLALVSQLRELAIELQRQLAASTTTIQELRSEIAQLERSSKREAAPFSKGARVRQPKGPGPSLAPAPSPSGKRLDPRESPSYQ